MGKNVRGPSNPQGEAADKGRSQMVYKLKPVWSNLGVVSQFRSQKQLRINSVLNRVCVFSSEKSSSSVCNLNLSIPLYHLRSLWSYC